MLISNKMTKHLKLNQTLMTQMKFKKITAARTPMKINRPVCVTCNQTLALKIGVKKTYQGRAH